MMQCEELVTVELVLLSVPDCPSAAVFEERLAAALAAHPAVVVHHRVVRDEREAEVTGMHGSPTLLIDGRDPFAAPGEPPSLSCRLYRDAAGQAGPVPSVEELRRALPAAGEDWARPARRQSPARVGERPRHRKKAGKLAAGLKVAG